MPRFDAGLFKGFVGTAMDVTEQEHLTRELRRREAYLAEAQRLSRTGSFGWRISTGEIVWSEETFRIFQYDPATKPTVEHVLQRVHPDDAVLVKQTIEHAAQHGNDFDFEHRLLMPDGSVKNVHAVAHAAKAADGIDTHGPSHAWVKGGAPERSRNAMYRGCLAGLRENLAGR